MTVAVKEFLKFKVIKVICFYLSLDICSIELKHNRHLTQKQRLWLSQAEKSWGSTTKLIGNIRISSYTYKFISLINIEFILTHTMSSLINIKFMGNVRKTKFVEKICKLNDI